MLICYKNAVMSKAPFTTIDSARSALSRLTMTELRILVAIRTAGNMSRAAVVLGVSQPALSQHVRDVEEKMGAALFVRHHRGLDPTPYGDVLLGLATALQLEMGIAAERLVQEGKDGQAPLRIGSMSVTSGGILAVALSRFVSNEDGPSVVLVEGSREVLLEHLYHRRIDLFIGRLPPRETEPQLIRETLFQDGAVVICSTRHRLASRSRINIKTLLDHPWIVPAEDTSFHQQIADSLRQANLPLPTARITSYSMLAFPAIVSTSNLLGFLPTSLYASGTLSASLLRLPVNLNWAPSPLGVLMRREVSKGPQAERLLEILRSVAASARASALIR